MPLATWESVFVRLRISPILISTTMILSSFSTKSLITSSPLSEKTTGCRERRQRCLPACQSMRLIQSVAIAIFDNFPKILISSGLFIGDRCHPFGVGLFKHKSGLTSIIGNPVQMGGHQHNNPMFCGWTLGEDRDHCVVILLQRGHGTSKVLFRTNYPMIMPQKALENIDDLGLRSETKELLLRLSAKRIFGL